MKSLSIVFINSRCGGTNHRRWRLLIVVVAVLVAALQARSQIDVTRALFTPPVVPETQTDPVRFEATVTGNPLSVLFRYDGVHRPMFDDGTNGDQTAGDATWTILFTPAEILSKNTAVRVFRPFIGFVDVEGWGSLNVFAEIWTSEIGLREIRPIVGGGQETDYIVNYVATRDELMTFSRTLWAQRFYETHGDDFDFINFVLLPGRRGNRFHANVKNQVQGIGLSIFDNAATHGSAGRLKGINQYPLSGLYDGGEKAFAHEVGHQWINFLSNTPYASGRPHWPKGSVAGNVMGFSIPPSGQGGDYPYTFTPNGLGGYVVGSSDTLIRSTFNSMELYLMGLIPPEEVGEFFVLTDQNQNLTVGQTLQPSEVTPVSLGQVTAIHGLRVPNSSQSQKDFRVATIVVSEQLLDERAMAFYDYFTRRTEATAPLPFASGFTTGTSNPWFLATGGRSVMRSSLNEDPPTPPPVVTNTDDSGPGSLRQAVMNANATPSDDEIVFNIPDCPDGVCTIVLTSGELVIGPSASSGSLTISNPEGPLSVIVSGNWSARIFHSMPGAEVSIDGLTLAAGEAPDHGGAIFNEGFTRISNSVFRSNSANMGGAIANLAGTLELVRSEIFMNGSLWGGGVFSRDGSVTIRDSTFANNVAYYGGGIYLDGFENFEWYASVTNSTFSGNQAVTTPEATGNGGAVYLANANVPVRFTNVTVTNNSASFGGGVAGDGLVGATIDLRNSIVAGNQASQFPEISTNVVFVNDLGNNLISQPALLAPLADNGGATRTHALLAGSPAINAGNNCVLTANGCGDDNPELAADQRGLARRGSVDIGAYEKGIAAFDFDGDGKADPAVFRASERNWYVNGSLAGPTGGQWGLADDVLVPGDYDGDGKTDFAIFRDGVWWVLKSTGGHYAVQWGIAGDKPVPADYDGDGQVDLAIVRNGVWWVLQSTGGHYALQWGFGSDTPVPADYDGDGKADIAILRDGVWWILNSTGGYNTLQWGLSTDQPVPADYDGDGKADLAIVRAGMWWILNSAGGYYAVQWGFATDVPVAADYDGDGKADPAIFRDGMWWILKSTGGYGQIHWGLGSDAPVNVGAGD